MFEITEAKVQGRSFPTGDRGGRSWRSYNAKSRAYVFIAAESVMDNLINRRNRNIAAFREVLLDQHPELKGKIRWSQSAGCSCGCSPGFILEDTQRADGRPADIFITAKFS